MGGECGLLVIDNSTLKHLESAEALERFRGNLRVSGWHIWPTAVNYLEAAKTRNRRVRSRLMATLRKLCGNRGLLPWPHQLLGITGRAILEDKNRFRVPWSGFEALLFEDELTATHVDRATEFIESQESRFQQLQDTARAQVQAFIRKRGIDDRKYDARRFLAEAWTTDPFHASALEDIWLHLDLPKPAPVAQLKNLDTWQLYFEAYGIAAYERAFVKQQESRVQLMDLLQLLYLGIGPTKRALATEDAGLLRAGSKILDGRYPRAQMCSIRLFLH